MYWVEVRLCFRRSFGRDVRYFLSTTQQHTCAFTFLRGYEYLLTDAALNTILPYHNDDDNDTVCACSTCHLILPPDLYDQLPEPSEDEEDMLDMAFGLTETSRLGCQITVTPAMEGVVLEMPKATRNFYVDGHKPKPH